MLLCSTGDLNMTFLPENTLRTLQSFFVLVVSMLLVFFNQEQLHYNIIKKVFLHRKFSS